MANHMWVCPTKKQDEFYNPEKLISLLKKEFPQYKFEDCFYEDNEYYIYVFKKNDESDVYNDEDLLFTMQCYSDFPYLDQRNSDEKTKFIDELDKMELEDLADKMISFLENDNMDLNKCIEIRHTIFFSDINLINRWMRQYFQAIIMDEGIHPEFLPPIPEGTDYRPKNDKEITKKFKDWIRRNN
jgi:hypothetical protein